MSGWNLDGRRNRDTHGDTIDLEAVHNGSAVEVPADAPPRAGAPNRVAIVAAICIGGPLIAILRRSPPETVVPLLLLAAAPVALVALARRSLTDTLLWAGYMLAFVAFAGLRANAHSFFPARAEYVIALERALFFDVLPTAWLQDRFYTLGSATIFDWSMIVVHLSYFLVPHMLALFVWAYYPAHLIRYFAAMIAICYVALGIQALVPTVPPWLAALTGYEHVHRIVQDVAQGVRPDTYERAYTIIGANDVAAMPSLHTAITVLVALMAARLGRTGAYVGGAYAIAMALALVYLGEHYVVDTIAGTALAIVIWLATKQWDPGRSRLTFTTAGA